MGSIWDGVGDGLADGGGFAPIRDEAANAQGTQAPKPEKKASFLGRVGRFFKKIFGAD